MHHLFAKVTIVRWGHSAMAPLKSSISLNLKRKSVKKPALHCKPLAVCCCKYPCMLAEKTIF